MTRKLKIKIAIEFRKHKPIGFRNVYAYVKRMPSGLYRIVANDHNGNMYFSSGDTFDAKSRAFWCKD